MTSSGMDGISIRTIASPKWEITQLILGNGEKVKVNFGVPRINMYFAKWISLSREAGSTVPREGFDSSAIMPFSWCVVAVTLSI